MVVKELMDDDGSFRFREDHVVSNVGRQLGLRVFARDMYILWGAQTASSFRCTFNSNPVMNNQEKTCRSEVIRAQGRIGMPDYSVSAVK